MTSYRNSRPLAYRVADRASTPLVVAALAACVIGFVTGWGWPVDTAIVLICLWFVALLTVAIGRWSR